MNQDKTFQFICCTNSQEYQKELVKYIDELHVPNNTKIVKTFITDAKSMAEGYRRGMESISAKYRIYLHQDSFILNREILFDLLEIFEDPSIGAVGVVGRRDIPKDGIFINHNVGNILMQSGLGLIHLQDKIPDKGKYTEAVSLDGCFIATQYDAPWRTDLFSEWDFYDVSQCFEMNRAGYKIVVPTMSTPWVYHDSGPSGMKNYYRNRDLFASEYLTGYNLVVNREQETVKNRMEDMAEALGKQLLQLTVQHRYGDIFQMSKQLELNGVLTDDICFARNISMICARETNRSQFLDSTNVEEMKKIYQSVRFTMIRLGHGYLDERKEMLKRMVLQSYISLEALYLIGELVLEKEINIEAILQDIMNTQIE